MTGDRNENPIRHRSRTSSADLEREERNFESIGSPAHAPDLGSLDPSPACSLREEKQARDSLWVTELLNQFDSERDALRARSKSAPSPGDGKTPCSPQAKANWNRLSAGPGSFPEACRGSADTEPAVQSPTLDPERVAGAGRRRRWPYAVCGAALILMGAVAARINFGPHRGALDTAGRRMAHASIDAPPTTSPAGSRTVRDIPAAETVTVLAPDGLVRTDGPPSAAIPSNGDTIELAAIVEGPDSSPAASDPRPARISLPQGPSARIVAPPKLVVASTRPPVDLMARTAVGEEGATLVPSPGSVRMEAPPDAGSSQEAIGPTRGEPPSAFAKAKERSKVARPLRRAPTGSGFSKQRRGVEPVLPHLAKADRPRSFTLPPLLRPTSH